EDEICPGGDRHSSVGSLCRLWLVCVFWLPAAHALLAQGFKSRPADSIATARYRPDPSVARKQAVVDPGGQRQGNVVGDLAHGQSAAGTHSGEGFTPGFYRRRLRISAASVSRQRGR